MKIFRSLLNFASDRFGHDDEPLLKVNPVSRLSRDRAWHVIPPRQGIIPDSKLAAWYKALLSLGNTTIRDYFLILLLTGFRRYESSTLLWTDVDFDKRIVRLRADVTKNHREHPMPMSDFLFELLMARYEKHRMSMYVFPGRNGRGRLTDFRQALIAVREMSGCQFTVHDLRRLCRARHKRRTFITKAEMLDISHSVIKRLANHHSNTDITSSYVIIDPERLPEPMDKIGKEFVRLMGADIDDLVLWRCSNLKQIQTNQLRLGVTVKPLESR